MVAKREININIRVTRRQSASWHRAAKREKKTLTAWLCNMADAAAVPAPPPVLPVVGGDQVELPLNGRQKS